MPTVQGSIKRDLFDHTKFTSTFLVDGTEFHYDGDFDSPVAEFDYKSATLTYEPGVSFGGFGPFTATISPANIELKLGEGQKITGNEEYPSEFGTSVNGTGAWIQY